MPSGVYISKERKLSILKLKAQGLTGKVIAIRTGLNRATISNIVKEDKKEQ